MPNTAAGYYFADGSTPMSAEDISAAEATAAEAVFSGFQTGNYFFRQTVYFTATDTFDKADYPWLRAVRVRCYGAGGGGGGAEGSGSSGASAASGGGSGSFAESWILLADLGASETVTVGALGAGGVNANGGGGGASSFGAHVVAGGGGGGARGVRATSSATAGGAGGVATAGDLQCNGTPAGWARVGSNFVSSFSNGAPSVLGGGGLASDNADAPDTDTFGAGGGGGTCTLSINRNGGDGGAGYVVVELFA